MKLTVHTRDNADSAILDRQLEGQFHTISNLEGILSIDFSQAFVYIHLTRSNVFIVFSYFAFHQQLQVYSFTFGYKRVSVVRVSLFFPRSRIRCGCGPWHTLYLRDRRRNFIGTAPLFLLA